MVEQADPKHEKPNAYHQHLKREKIRKERRKAKRDPEAPPTYGKYRGYES